jgi:branched-chain amino acid transport system ATP-binding protein
MAPLLEVRNLTKRFGGLVAVSDVSFAVQPGEIFGIIGPNGAGKTTLFNVIAGHFKPSAGAVLLEGTDIAGHPSDEIGRLGIARTFQAVHLFRKETVAENLRRAAVIAARYSPLAYFTSSRPPASAAMEDVARFLGLEDRLALVAGGLSYGQQKMLGIGMAMMVRPRLVLMDEPAAGLNSSEKLAIRSLIRRLRDERAISVLLVEHDMPLVMGLCDRILVVNQGKPLALGTPADIRSDAGVIEAYLGEDYEFA